jgi:hypothetical protein
MIHEFEYYHGVVLRSIILAVDGQVGIEKHDEFGRVNTYLVNDYLAIHVKHSSKRLTPWNFSLTTDHWSELLSILRKGKQVCLLFVCGQDGIVALSMDEIMSITEARPGGVASVRIDRNRGQMYRVFGNAGQLASLKSRGVAQVVEAILALKK